MIDFQKKKKVDMSLSPENDPPNIRTKKKKKNKIFFFVVLWSYPFNPANFVPPEQK